MNKTLAVMRTNQTSKNASKMKLKKVKLIVKSQIKNNKNDFVIWVLLRIVVALTKKQGQKRKTRNKQRWVMKMKQMVLWSIK